MANTMQLANQGGQSIEMPDGTHYNLRALDMNDITQIENEAVANYKRGILKTLADNSDLLEWTPEEKRAALLAKMDELKSLSIDQCPKMPCQFLDKGPDGKMVIDPETKLPKTAARPMPYGYWFLNHTTKGMIVTVWLSARKDHPEVDMDRAAAIFMVAGEEKLREAAEIVTALTSPDAGNPEAAAEPSPAATAAKPVASPVPTTP